MADEYQVYWLGAETVLSDESEAAIYYIAAEAVVTDYSEPQIYYIAAEAVLTPWYKFSLSLLDEADTDGLLPLTYIDQISLAFLDESAFDEFPGFSVDSWLGEEPDVPVEWNPYSPEVPAALAETDPAAYDFQREQAETLREQHNLAQAGDSTFPWEMAFKLSETPAYTLGALTRFFHPEYGIAQARYVKFSDRWTGTYQSPVGVDTRYDNDWIVVDDPDKSHPTRLVGISIPYETDLANKYGWVLTQGRGLFEFFIQHSQAPEKFQLFTWGTNAGYGQFTTGRKLGIILDTKWIREVLTEKESFDPRRWRIPPGAWGVELEGVTDEYIQAQVSEGVEALGDRVEALENADDPELVDYSDDIAALQSSINILTTNLNGEISHRYTADQSLSARLTTLEESTDLGGGTTLADFYILQDRVTSIEDIQVPRITALEGLVGTLNSTVSFLSGWQTGAESRLVGLETVLLSFPALTDFDNQVRDAVADLLVAGDDITLTYDDVSIPRTLTIESTAVGGGGGAPWYWDPPAAADFSTDSGDATLPIMTDDDDIGLSINFGTLVTGNIRRIIYKALPSAGATDWEVVVKLEISHSDTSGNLSGLIAYDSATGRSLMWTHHGAGTSTYIRADRGTALAGGVTMVTGLGTPSGIAPPKWLKLNYDATAELYSYSISWDGKNWILVGSNTVARSTVFSTGVADRIGLVSYTGTTSANWLKVINCEHWSQSW